MSLSTGSTNYRPPLERSKSAPKLGSIEETIEEEEEEDQSPTEEEEENGVRGPMFHASPVGSLAISETMSDIVQYNNRSTELGTSLQLSRTSSQRDKSSDQEEDSSDTASAKINSNDSHLNINSRTNRSSYNASSNSSSSSSSSSSHKHCLSSSLKLVPNLKPPVIRRRYLRSISVDTGFDTEDVDDFDDSDDNSGEKSTSVSPSRLLASEAAPSRTPLRIAFTSAKVDDCSEEDLCNSLTSTDTTETVLDRIMPEDMRSTDCTNFTDAGTTTRANLSGRLSPHIAASSSRDKATDIEHCEVMNDPHTTEDTITLINCLTHSFSRQMTLPETSQPPEESLTSDQPESLGSCSSSCGGCSDTGADQATEGKGAGQGGTEDARGRLLGLVVIGNNLENLGNLSELAMNADEPDNISEESGYAEDKDFLHCNSDNTKILSTAQ